MKSCIISNRYWLIAHRTIEHRLDFQAPSLLSFVWGRRVVWIGEGSWDSPGHNKMFSTYVAELSSGCHDDRSVVILDEHTESEKRHENADGWENKRNNRPRTEPGNDFRLELVAVCFVRVGCPAGFAGQAGVVEDVGIVPTGDATPAALILCEEKIKLRTKKQKTTLCTCT